MPASRFRVFKHETECFEWLGEKAYPPSDDEIYCNATWDRVLCWPATPADETAYLPCPPFRGLDPTKFGARVCGPDGRWVGRGGLSAEGKHMRNDTKGWTNYTNCYTPDALKIYQKLFGNTSPQTMKEIGNMARVMETVGLCISLMSITVSLFIFHYFRSLKCDRTRIHRNLFFAIMIHVAIQLIVHIDHIVAKSSGSDVEGTSVGGDRGTIYSTPVLCEALKAMVEYTKTVMFVWMFIEGMYLHNMLVVSVFSGRPNYVLFYILGWGIPLVLTITWTVVNVFKDTEKCWFMYSFKPQYWILEGPRAAIIAVNLLFLLNIIRVLVTKLRESHSNEAEQVRKAVKAAIVLLPLLGVNNFLAMVETPTDSAVKFGIFTFVSQFLISFQGFFISLLYCFLNTEVRDRLRRAWFNRFKKSGYLKANTGVSSKVRAHLGVVNGHRKNSRRENGSITGETAL